MEILAISDQRLPKLGNAEFIRQQYAHVKALVSCGDLDVDYVDFLASILNTQLYFVKGNHDHHPKHDSSGGINLHRKITMHNGYMFAGLEGSIRYNKSGVQYTESEMAGYVLAMMPMLLLRRQRKGYGVDLFVAHSPPRNINDAIDYAHRGFRSFRWLIRWARPRYFIHGHVDIYDQRVERINHFFKTKVININPSMLIDLAKK